MTIIDLTTKENIIYRKVEQLSGPIEHKLKKCEEEGFFEDYKKIHSAYSELAKENIEALKRALFLQWYSISEPAWYTGILNLEEYAKKNTILALNDLIEKKEMDYEIKWMLNYYGEWDYIFKGFNGLKGLSSYFSQKQNVEIPNSINKKEMIERGQMGKYWCSLSMFQND